MMQSHGKRGKNAFPKKFKCDCRICGKKGHKATDCWENPKNKGKKPVVNNRPTSHKSTYNYKEKLNCSYCGKDNHTVENALRELKLNRRR
jgi:hypothetical protein